MARIRNLRKRERSLNVTIVSDSRKGQYASGLEMRQNRLIETLERKYGDYLIIMSICEDEGEYRKCDVFQMERISRGERYEHGECSFMIFKEGPKVTWDTLKKEMLEMDNEIYFNF